jgi:hypothetical protein
LAEHRWVCGKRNLKASCIPDEKYRSRWKADSQFVGIAYDWGGFDGPEDFDRKLAMGHAAGSHSEEGVTECTTGIDCSGFVSYCWGQQTKYGTSTIDAISGRPKYNWFTDMKPGDALVKPGAHIVLFAGYRSDGNPLVYEASGGKSRVLLNNKWTWATLNGYFPIAYKMVAE